MEAYAVESAHARAQKLAKRGDRRAAVAADIAQVYASDAAERIAAASRSVSATLLGRTVDRAFAHAVEQLAAPTAFDAISARRRIADAVIENGKYPL
jgi:hypothetical protein